MPHGELVTFVFQRWLRDGSYEPEAVDRLDGLRPHFARAGMIAARLGLERAEATVSALKTMGLPAAVMAASGSVLTVNELMEAMPGVFLPAAGGDMAIGNAPANALFQQAIIQNREDVTVRSIPVPAKEGQPAMVIHVLPLRRAAHEIFSGADILVAATSMNASALVPSPTILTGLFDLTPAEAKLGLAGGKALKVAAAEQNIQFSTARYYLDQIFRKTGVNQQSELVALLKVTQPLPRVR